MSLWVSCLLCLGHNMQHHLVTRLLLASYQRPADWSHVSARLSVNKRSPLPSPSLGLFTLSPSSASCLPHLALRLSVRLIAVLLWNQVLLLCFLICLIFTLSLHCLRRCHCSFWEFLLSYPHFLSLLLPTLCWDPAAIMTSLDDEGQCAPRISWMRESKCWQTMYHNTKGNDSDQSDSQNQASSQHDKLHTQSFVSRRRLIQEKNKLHTSFTL